jgi:AcrR family transcriptional regulator
MPTKAERTTQYIIETVAPLFNQRGYSATSLSDITSAVGLTKGAIYGNFKNKEELALKAFEYNKGLLIDALEKTLDKQDNPKDKLFAFTDFYANYNLFTDPIGGCPILNVGVDSNQNNPQLLEAVRDTIREIRAYITAILEEGEQSNAFHIPIKASQFARQLFTMIMGAVSMATITQDVKFLKNTVAYINLLIEKEINK